VINTVGILAVTVMSLVITPQDVLDKLPPGTPVHKVEEYLVDLSGWYSYWVKLEKVRLGNKFPWQEDDVGLYVVNVPGVRTHWWLPSLGRNLQIKVGISERSEVTHVEVSYYFTGYP